MDGHIIVIFRALAIHSCMLATVRMMSNTILKDFQMEICSCSHSGGIWLIAMVGGNKKCDGEHRVLVGFWPGMLKKELWKFRILRLLLLDISAGQCAPAY